MAGLTEKQWMQIFILPTLRHAGRVTYLLHTVPPLLDFGRSRSGRSRAHAWGSDTYPTYHTYQDLDLQR
jgi:hypothetical protein